MIEQLISTAAKRLEVDKDDIEWWSWPINIPSHFNYNGADMMAKIQCYAFRSWKGDIIKYCNGIWKPCREILEEW